MTNSKNKWLKAKTESNVNNMHKNNIYIHIYPYEQSYTDFAS